MGNKSDKAGPEITSEAALAFIREMQKRFPKAPRTKAEKARLQEYLASFGDAYLKAVGSRVQGDLMLRPPRTVHPEDVGRADASNLKPRASQRSRGAGRAPTRGDRDPG